MSTAIQLLRQGRKTQIWTKYCGFLDLNLDEFMGIQERLLLEQIDLISKTEGGRKFFGNHPPTSVDEFRRIVPITTYDDYEEMFDQQRENLKYEGTYLWAHTSGRSGQFKWIPYTREAYLRLGERILSGIILAAAREKGDVRLREGDTLVYNTPPRPYISGVILRALGEQFPLSFVPHLDETESMGFQERIEKSFEIGLETGIDILGSMTVVLVKMGERFAEGARTAKLSGKMLNPKVAFRLLRAVIRSKLHRRPMLPRDIWNIKALICGGADTVLYRDKIAYYWGAQPYEQYGSTEEGPIATQAWNKKGMTFFPDACFLEFIPEEEWSHNRRDSSYQPSTVLYNQVETNKRYEIIITSLYGKPLVRYRTNDMIAFTELEDRETGVKLPQMNFVARADDYIDLAGFAGLIDEKMVWQSILKSGIEYNEWAIRKETIGGEPVLHLYIETKQPIPAEEICRQVHNSLKQTNPFYADYETLIQKRSLEVTVLSVGTFQAYMLEKQSAGADLAHLKPAHMNTSDEVINLLLRLSHQIAS